MISTVFYNFKVHVYQLFTKKRNILKNVAFLCVKIEFSLKKKKKDHLFTHKHAFCNLHFIFDPPPVKLDPPYK